MAGIFGSAAGTSQAMADMQQAAQTQGQQLQNQQAALQLQEQQKMSQMMAQAATNPEEAKKSPADRMEGMARMALNAGLTASGSKLATDAAEVRLKEAQSRHANAQTFEQQSAAAKTELNTVSRLLQDVHDQASWDAANGLFEQITGRKSPFQGMEYNPVVVHSLQQSALSLKDKLDLSIKQQNADTRRAAEKSAASFRDFRKGVIEQQQVEREQRNTAATKVYGTNAVGPSPKKSELDAAVAVLEQLHPGLPTEEVNNAAHSVAQAARAIQQTTPGISQKEALQRAAQDMKELGLLDDAWRASGQPPSADETLANQVALAREGQTRSQVVGGWGKEGVARWSQIEGMALKQIMNENPGMSRQDAARQFANEQIGLHARQQSIGQLTKMQGATKQAVDQLEFNVQQTTRIMQDIPSTDLSPVLNAIARGEQKWTGDPRYNQLFYYMSAVAAESARILSGGQASVAQLHAGAQQEARQWADAKMTPRQFIEGTAPALMAEGRKRLETYQNAIDSQNARPEHTAPLPGQGAAPGGVKPPIPPRINSDADYNALPSGAQFTAPDGTIRRKP